MITDLIIIVALIYLFAKGWSRGFFKTLLGPISLVLGCIIAFVYYQKTQDLVTSLAICIIGPFIITIIVSLILKIWHKATKDQPPVLPFSSKILGSMFSILWGGSYLAITLLLIGLLPVKIEKLKPIQDDVMSSKSYTLLSQLTSNTIPGASYDINKIQNLLNNPEQVEQLQSSPEFQEFAEDERLIELFSDEKIAEQIQNKNYTQLLSNPEIQAIFQDPELLKKFFALNKKIMEDSSGESGKSQPKIINVR